MNIQNSKARRRRTTKNSDKNNTRNINYRRKQISDSNGLGGEDFEEE